MFICIGQLEHCRWCVHDSRLLYYLIREIKTWLNINHITVHNNTTTTRKKQQEERKKERKNKTKEGRKEEERKIKRKKET